MELTTARLQLREFIADDWHAVYAYQSDARYLRYYPWDGVTPAQAQAFVTRFIAQQQAAPRTRFQLAITLRTTRELIGNCGVRMDAAEAVEGDIGYELAPWQWGHGYATEAAATMVEFGFGALGLHRIWAECIADNTASAHVLEKLGMRREGLLRQNRWMKGRWWDTALYAILVDEWRAAHRAPTTDRKLECGGIIL